MAQLIDGRFISDKIKNNVKIEVENLKKSGIGVCLAVVLVGNDPASRIYVKNKRIACEKVGIVSKEIVLDEKISESELLCIISNLNRDSKINGILVQLPLPKHLNETKVINYIDPLKDVDAFCPINVGKIMIGKYDFLPCTPAGVLDLIDSTGVSVCGKNCVVIGRSNIVGKPMAMLLLHRSGTVTVCHSRTKDLKTHTQNADILISAVGISNFVKVDMVKPGAIVIDVGINRGENGKICGDVDFEGVKEVVGYITPVPGGVGPMTIAKLMENALKAAKIQNSI